jgi:hypothetical protein
MSASAKTMQVVSGMLNPVTPQDLADIWDSLLASLRRDRTQIVAGLKTTGSVNDYGAGYIFDDRSGVVGYFPGGIIDPAQYLWMSPTDSETVRTFPLQDAAGNIVGDGQEHVVATFATVLVSASATTAPAPNATLIGQGSKENIDLWRSWHLADGSVTDSKIVSLSASKLTGHVENYQLDPSLQTSAWMDVEYVTPNPFTITTFRYKRISYSLILMEMVATLPVENIHQHFITIHNLGPDADFIISNSSTTMLCSVSGNTSSGWTNIIIARTTTNPSTLSFMDSATYTSGDNASIRIDGQFLLYNAKELSHEH